MATQTEPFRRFRSLPPRRGHPGDQKRHLRPPGPSLQHFGGCPRGRNVQIREELQRERGQWHHFSSHYSPRDGAQVSI